MSRYQTFIEEAEEQGVGELADLETIAQCWAWLDVQFDDQPQNRLWWIKDREQERVASAMHCGDIWQAECETPAVFILWLGMFFGWDETELV